MRKAICLFLILWLPLFMGSAWAMNMQMELQNQLPQIAQQSQKMAHNMATNMQMPASCHMNIASETNKKCPTCSMCALAHASASFDTAPNFNVLSTTSLTPPYSAVAFYSQDLPPTIKPPILN